MNVEEHSEGEGAANRKEDMKDLVFKAIFLSDFISAWVVFLTNKSKKKCGETERTSFLVFPKHFRYISSGHTSQLHSDSTARLFIVFQPE